MSENFRYDINFLRAFAVVSVVLFHFQPEILPGGFIGVDVFFVISGYLMTGIICKKLDAKQFSFINYYISRTNRILPPLLFLVLVMFSLGWLFLGPIDFYQLSKHIPSVLNFTSNIMFWRETGYFDSSSLTKWLLHTWSLSAEWQFYLLYPFFLTLSYKIFGKNNTAKITVLFTVLVYISNIFITARFVDAAYFLLPTRVWEMTAGGCIYFYSRKYTPQTVKTLCTVIGWLLLFCSLVFVSKSLPWPGYAALVPTLGTLLILYASLDIDFYSRPVFEKIGRYSYSIYLWHWPVVVLGGYLSSVFDVDWFWTLLGVPLSFFLGFLSYRYIEIKSLYLVNISKQKFAIVFVHFMFVTLFSLSFYFDFGPSYSEEVRRIYVASNDVEPRHTECLKGAPCIYGEGEVKVQLVGDSHANASVSAISKGVNGAVETYKFSSCPTFLNMAGNTPCNAFNRKVFESIGSGNLPLVIINSTTAYAIGGQALRDRNAPIKPSISFESNNEVSSDADYLEAYSDSIVDTACKYSNNRDVYLVRPYPRMIPNLPNELIKHLMFGQQLPDTGLDFNDYIAINKFVFDAQDRARAQCGVKILESHHFLCDESSCFGTRDGIPIYYDSNHLTETGNKLLSEMFSSIKIQ
ncbi:acyltransferase family protein [Vibrio breoganii]